MKALIPVLLLAVQSGSAPKHTLFVVDKVSQISTAHVYGNTANEQDGEHHSAPVVMAEFSKKCPSVSFTQDRTVADFILQTQPGGSTLTDQKGNVLYISPAKTLKNMTKDVCTFIGTH